VKHWVITTIWPMGLKIKQRKYLSGIDVIKRVAEGYCREEKSCILMSPWLDHHAQSFFFTLSLFTVSHSIEIIERFLFKIWDLFFLFIDHFRLLEKNQMAMAMDRIVFSPSSYVYRPCQARGSRSSRVSMASTIRSATT